MPCVCNGVINHVNYRMLAGVSPPPCQELGYDIKVEERHISKANVISSWILVRLTNTWTNPEKDVLTR